MIALAVKKRWILPSKQMVRTKLVSSGVLVNRINTTYGVGLRSFIDYFNLNKNYFRKMRKALATFRNKMYFNFYFYRPGNFGKRTRKWYLNHYKDRPWMIKGYYKGKYQNPYKQPWFKNKNHYQNKFNQNKFNQNKPMFRTDIPNKKPWFNNNNKSNPNNRFNNKPDFKNKFSTNRNSKYERYPSKPMFRTDTGNPPRRSFSTHGKDKNLNFKNKFPKPIKLDLNKIAKSYPKKKKVKKISVLKDTKVKKVPKLTEAQKFQKLIDALPLEKRLQRERLVRLQKILPKPVLSFKKRREIATELIKFNNDNEGVEIPYLINFHYGTLTFIDKDHKDYDDSLEINTYADVKRIAPYKDKSLTTKSVRKPKIKPISTKPATNIKSPPRIGKNGKPWFKRPRGWYDKRLYLAPLKYPTPKLRPTKLVRPKRVRLLRIKLNPIPERFSTIINNPTYPSPFRTFTTRGRLAKPIYLHRKYSAKGGYRLSRTLFKKLRKVGRISKFFHWVRIVNKPNNAYVSIVKPDRIFMRKFFPKVSRRTAKRKLYKVRSKLPIFIALANRNGLDPLKVARSNYKRYFRLNFQIKKAHRRTGKVITLITAGTSKTMKEKDRGTFAAAQDAGYSAAKFLHKRKIKKIVIDSFNNYHFRLKAVYKGLAAFKPSNLKLTGFRAFPKLPHSKGLRKRKQRRT